MHSCVAFVRAVYFWVLDLVWKRGENCCVNDGDESLADYNVSFLDCC